MDDPPGEPAWPPPTGLGAWELCRGVGALWKEEVPSSPRRRATAWPSSRACCCSSSLRVVLNASSCPWIALACSVGSTKPVR